MFAFENPASKAFVAHLEEELLLGQVLIRRRGCGFELRHTADQALAAEVLRPLAVAELRELAQFTVDKAFRPLKTAPTLPVGWRCAALTESELESALNHLYPGAVADWFAGQSGPSPVTDYRAFSQRQTGMYRITQLLSDQDGTRLVGDICSPSACLKRRLWSLAALAPDAATEKSIIPCLEPCVILLEVARKTARADQDAQRKASLKLAISPESE